VEEKPLPVYGDGQYTRDWLYVVDHARAIDLVYHEGENAETYNIGGFNEWTNIDLIKVLCAQMDEKLGREKGSSEKLITYVKDRPGHDRRYAIDATKINKELGWAPSVTFEEGLAITIDWYLSNAEWLKNVTSGTYQEYYDNMYASVSKLRIAGIKSTNPLAVGDSVRFEEEETAPELGVISGIETRKNYIIRKSVNLSKRVHIIAANMDQALLVTTLAQPATSTGFMDRFLATAEAYNIPVIIVFNKCDVYTEALQGELEYRKAVYQSIGYRCMETSATEGLGLDELKALLQDKTTLLSGHSGVGKSTLINAIEPQLELRTAAVSTSHNKGQHTTTYAEMHALGFGGDIIDTPGIKGFGLVNMEKEEISHFFPEIFAQSKTCKYHNCLHVNEPQCAVKNALNENRIAPTRYESYINQLNDHDETTHYRSTEY